MQSGIVVSAFVSDHVIIGAEVVDRRALERIAVSWAFADVMA